MAYGLFGKAPQKRDFLSLNMPNSVLHPFETWLQSAVAASRSELGRDWDSYYLVAPIWRFWLGREVLGTACMGAVMSSLDQVGRYFPLAIVYYAEPGEELVPPLMNAQAAWFEAIEQRLLVVLSRTHAVDIASLMDGLLPPDGATRLRATAPGQPFAVLGQAPVGMTQEPRSELVSQRVPVGFSAPPPAASPLPAVDEEDTGASPGADQAAPPPDPDTLNSAAHGGSVWDDASEDGAGPAVLVDPAEPQSEPMNVAGPTETTFASLWGDTGQATGGAAEGGTPASLWGDPTPIAVQRAESLQESSAARPLVAVETDFQPAAEPLPYPVPVSSSRRVLATQFRGGVSLLVEGEIDEPGPQGMLLEQDHLSAAAARSYWWCRLPAMGASRAYLKQGLPDPFFYSRMLLWEPQQERRDVQS